MIRRWGRAMLPYGLVRWIQERREARRTGGDRPHLHVVAEINAQYGGRKLMHCVKGAIGAHVIFNGAQVDACCMPTHGRQPFLFDYGGGEFPVEIFYRAVVRLISENQEGRGDCAGCAHLKKIRVARGFMPDAPSFIGQGHANRCTARCIYCVQTHSGGPGFDSMFDMAVTVRSMVFQRFFRPGETIFSWGGGEPTALRDFGETCRTLALCDFRQNVNTNAIEHSPVLEEVLSRGRATVQVSVDSGTRECYRRVKGVDRFDEVWSNIRRYAGSDAIVLKYIVFSANSEPDEVDAFLRLSREAGIRALTVSGDLNSTQSPMFELSYKAVVGERELTAAARLLRDGRRQGMEVSLDHTWTPVHVEQIRRLADG